MPQFFLPLSNNINRQNAWFRSIIDNAPDAVFGINEADVIVDWNRQAVNTFGWTQSEALGRNLGTIIPNAIEYGISCKILRQSNKMLPSKGHHTEGTARHRHGHFFPVEITAIPTFVEDRLVHYFFMRDITEHKRALEREEQVKRKLADEALRESEERFRATFDQAAVAISISTIEGKWISFNQIYPRMFGYNYDELKQMSFIELTYPDDREQDQVLIRELIEGKRSSFIREKRYLHKEGSIVWGVLNASLVRDGSGNGKYIVAVIQDITDRKHAVEKLQASEARYRSLFEQSPLSTQTFDPLGRTIQVNRAWQRLWGLEGDVVKQLVYEKYNILEDQQLKDKGILNLVEKAFQGQPVSIPAIYYDPKDSGQKGRPRWLEAYIYPIKDSSGRILEVTLIHHDVTEVKQAEIALRESEFRFRQLADSMPQIAWTAQPGGKIDYCNKRWYEFTGLCPREQEKEKWTAVIHSDDIKRVTDEWKKAVATGELYQVECRFRNLTSQTYRWFLGRALPIYDHFGKIVKWFGTCTDIDEQKRVQADLKRVILERDESLRVIESISRSGRVLSAELDLDKLVQKLTDTATQLSKAQFGAFFYNVTDQAGESYTLYTLSGVPRKAFADFPMPRNTRVFGPTFKGEAPVRSADITKDERYGLNEPYYGMPKGHLPVRSYLAVPVISSLGEVLGGLFFGHSKVGVFTEQEEELVVGLASQAAIAIDNARLFKRAQEAIQARDQFLSICSHELKTPLTAIKLQAQITSRQIDKNRFPLIDPSWLKQVMENTDRQLDQVSRLVDDMLDVSRIMTGRLSLTKQIVNLSELATNATEQFMVQAKASGSALSVNAEEEVFVKCDPHRMGQVIGNLISNAIKYGNQQPIELSVRNDNGRARLDVKDQGIGIAPENIERIFDRFERASSADNISGLGLGLFITRQIVESHGGSIVVASELNQGSLFTIFLKPTEKG